MEQLAELVIPAFAGIAVVAVPAWFTYRAKVQALKQALEEKVLEIEARDREMQFQARALSRADAFVRDAAVYQEMEKLVAETEIDRVLILTAWNGRFVPKWTTAVWQLRDAGQRTTSYVHTPLDTDYQDKLKEVEEKSFMQFVVGAMPQSLIRGIYEDEGVRASVWTFVGGEEKAEGREVTYMSFATHETEEISPGTVARCRVLSGMLAATGK